MGLSLGTRLGPYEILSPLGAGGMGEVWRARDTRVDRPVALKVLPEEFFESEEKGARFGREARTLASLNHPCIAVLYSFEEIEGRHILVMELLEGESLRALVSRGPLPVRRALEIAEQVAQGLAAAHEKGIVHRDVKPENVFVTKDGHVKVLDFGLARAGAIPAGRDETESPTVEKLTSGGAVVGTVAYMSPEQARGLAVDHRSDQFSLGVVLYEMLAGRRPFKGDSAAETLTAIIREEPEPVSREGAPVPAPVRWVVERCLAKEPVDRYDSTRDLARELASCRAHLSEGMSGAIEPAVSARRHGAILRRAPALAVVAVVLVGGVLIGRRTAARQEPKIQRLTFRRGTVHSARFVPDGRTVVYAASWEGKPSEVFSVRLDGPESRPLGFPGAGLLAVSHASELALALESRYAVNIFYRTGTLARVSFSGGTPRPLEPRIAYADFSRDGSEMALVREADAGMKLEFPLGKIILDPAPGWLSEPRLSPSSNLVAFMEHPSVVGGDNAGWVAVLDRAGGKRKLTDRYLSAQGLAWTPRGDEIWFTAVRAGARMELRAVTLGGRERLVFGQTQPMVLQDVHTDGRVLVTGLDWRARAFFRRDGDAADREMTWLDWSWPTDLSQDGKLVTFAEGGEGTGSAYQIYIRETAGAPAMKLGPGRWGRFSPDGRFVVTPHTDPDTIAIYPVGAGISKTVTLRGFHINVAGILPDGESVWFAGRDAQGDRGLWLTDLAGKPPRLATREKTRPRYPFATRDGRYFIAAGDQGVALFPVAGGEPRPVHGLSDDDFVVGISADTRYFYIQRLHEVPAKIRRVDTYSEKSELVHEISPADPAGVSALSVRGMTPDGKNILYGTTNFLSELYVIEGLR